MTGGSSSSRRAALVTGVGKRIGIGAGIAARLADEGWDPALVASPTYDADRPDAAGADEPERIATDLRGRGAGVILLDADLGDPDVPDRVVADAGGAPRPPAGGGALPPR